MGRGGRKGNCHRFGTGGRALSKREMNAVMKLPHLGLIAAGALILAGCRVPSTVKPPSASDIVKSPVAGETSEATDAEGQAHPPGWSATQVIASAKYVRIQGALPEAKGVLAFLADEAGLRAGAVSLTQEQANEAQRALCRLAGTDLRSTPTVTVASGNPAKMSFIEDMSGMNEPSAIKITVGGVEQEWRAREVGVSLGITPHVLADGVIQMGTFVEVTNFEGFVEYGGTEVVIPSTSAEAAGAEKPVVKVPSGFYQPVFSTNQVRSDVRIAEGRVIVLKAEHKAGITPEEVARVIKAKPAGVRTETLLVFLTAKAVPTKR